MAGRSPARMHGAAALATLATGVVLAAGCGNARPPPAGEQTIAPVGSAAGGFGQDAGPPLPGCGAKDNGSYCDCVDVPLLVDTPNLYFVLDRSGSMADQNKWDQVRVTVAQVLRQVGARANFAATIFPGPSGTNACAPGVEVMPLRQGDPPSTTDGPTTRLLLSQTNVVPQGGTPTAATLQAVLPSLRKLTGTTYVILATDGGPNCNTAAQCNVDQCIPNIEAAAGCSPVGPENCCVPPLGAGDSCLDAQPTVDAVGAIFKAGFPVFVIGIPGSAPYATLLDQVAVAGGTANGTSPKYFRVDSTGSNELLLTLKRVAAKIVATCAFKLKQPPQDPGLVNVYFDQVIVPEDPNWKLEGDTVTLLGDACTRVMNGDVLDVRIITGCPTVLR